MQNGEEEEDEEEWAGTLGKFRQMAGWRRGGDLRLMGLLLLFFFFLRENLIPAEIGRNVPKLTGI